MAIVGFAELVQYHALLALALGLRVPLVDRLHVFPTCLRTHPRRPRKTHYIAPFGNILSELTGEAWVTFLLIRFGTLLSAEAGGILRRYMGGARCPLRAVGRKGLPLSKWSSSC